MVPVLFGRKGWTIDFTECKWNVVPIEWTGLTAVLVESFIESPIKQEFLEPQCMTVIQIDFQQL